MTRPPLRSSVLVLLAALAIVSAACDTGPRPAAEVGDLRVTEEQLAEDIALFRFLAGLSGAPCGTAVAGESQESACARFTLTNVIQEDLVRAYAIEHELAVDPDEVTSAIAQLEQSLGAPEALDAQLAAEDLDRDDLRALATRLLLFNVVQDAVVDERLDEDALEAAYEAEKTQFTTVEVRHILVEDEDEARRIAAEVTSETFARFAKRLSEDPGSAPNGGSLGVYSEAQFVQQFDPTFVGAALTLGAGQISGAVQSQSGWHVIELVRRDVATYEQVRDQLAAREAVPIFSAWLQEQIETVRIQVNPRYGRLDTETGEVVPIRSTSEDGEAPAPTGATGFTGPTGP